MSALPDIAADSRSRRGWRGAGARIGAVQRRAPLIQVIVLVALFLYGATSIDGLTSGPSLRSMLVLAALLGLAGAGQTVVVLLRGIDLSISSYISGGAIAFTTLVDRSHWAPVPAIVALLATAALLGGLTGWVCHRFDVQPLVVTLGVGSAVIGGILVWTGGVPGASVPDWLTQLTSPAGRTFGTAVPPIVVLWALVAVLLAIVLHRTVIGRRLYATGANLRAARLALVNTGRVWTAAFAFSALMSAATGMLLAGFSGGSDPSLGDPYLFQGLAAVIVGGTSVDGGGGDYWRTILGALILTLLTTILVSKGSNAADQQILFGLLILLAVAGYGRDTKPSKRN